MSLNLIVVTRNVAIKSIRLKMAGKEKIDLEKIILEILANRDEVNIHNVAERAGLTDLNATERRAIQRAFAKLIKDKKIEPFGKARARVYRLLSTQKAQKKDPVEPDTRKAFKEIELSEQAEVLLRQVSKQIKGRTPVGYNQNFLNNYVPNTSYYLSLTLRQELMEVGKVEGQVRPAGTYARNILNRLLIDLSWNSSRLEGNTYSLLETKRLIELGESAIGKDITEAQMILNHKGAIEYIVDSAGEDLINSQMVCSVHALLSENLLGDPSASGRIRQIAVGIGGTTYMPLENPHILQECFEIFIDKLNMIDDPFEQSFFSLVHLSYLQAFEDVNKRTARLVANISLIKNNLRPLAFTDVEQEAYVKSLLGVYEMNDISLLRDLYVWAYKRSSQRYSAVQSSMGGANLLKLKYRAVIQDVIRGIIQEKIPGPQVVNCILSLLEDAKLERADEEELFKIIEIEIASLHEGNIARFKIRPSEYQAWKALQR